MKGVGVMGPNLKGLPYYVWFRNGILDKRSLGLIFGRREIG